MAQEADVLKQCAHCRAPVERYHNYCGWECMVEQAKQSGGRIHTPNNLPIGCIKADGTMLEHEHGDHPDYMFPVEAQYVGGKPEEVFRVAHSDGTVEPMSEEWAKAREFETHALIYTDGHIALTLYECRYSLWSLRDGRFLSGPKWLESGWRLTGRSLAEIHDRLAWGRDE